MGYKIYFLDSHSEWIDTITYTPGGSIIFYTSGPRKCRYAGVFEEEKTRVTWDEKGIPHFEDYWITMDIIDIRLEKAT